MLYPRSIFTLIIIILYFNITYAQGNLTIEDLGKNYTLQAEKLLKGLYLHIPSDKVNHGNTSIRNTDASHLVWKDSPSSNGYGYFQRNRDMGQVFE